MRARAHASLLTRCSRARQVPEAANDSKAFKERAEARKHAQRLPAVTRALPDAPARAQHDVTGWTVWASSVILARYLCKQGAPLLAGADCLELGAGCGLSGLAAAQRAAPARVWLTDFNAATVANLEANAAANAASCAPLTCSRMDWDQEATFPHDAGCDSPRAFGAVIGADLVYRRSYARKLAAVLDAVVQPGGVFVFATPGQREGLPTLRSALASAGWACEAELEAPAEWRANPLRHDAADADAAAQTLCHFPELAMKSMAYPLNVLVWRKSALPAARDA